MPYQSIFDTQPPVTPSNPNRSGGYQSIFDTPKSTYVPVTQESKPASLGVNKIGQPKNTATLNREIADAQTRQLLKNFGVEHPEFFDITKQTAIIGAREAIKNSKHYIDDRGTIEYLGNQVSRSIGETTLGILSGLNKGAALVADSISSQNPVAKEIRRTTNNQDFGYNNFLSPIFLDYARDIEANSRAMVEAHPNWRRRASFEDDSTFKGVLGNIKEAPVEYLSGLIVSEAPMFAAQLITYWASPWTAIAAMGAMSGGETYEEALANGVKKDKAITLGLVRGTVEAGLEKIGFDRILGGDGTKQVASSLANNFMNQIKNVTATSLIEGGTEMMQELSANAIAATFDENKELMEKAWNELRKNPIKGLTSPEVGKAYKALTRNTAKAGLIGGILGGGTTGAIGSAQISTQATGSAIDYLAEKLSPTNKVELAPIPVVYDVTNPANNAGIAFINDFVEPIRTQGEKFITTNGQVSKTPIRGAESYRVIDARTVNKNQDARSISRIRPDQSAKTIYDASQKTNKPADIAIDAQGNFYASQEVLDAFNASQEARELSRIGELDAEIAKVLDRYTSVAELSGAKEAITNGLLRSYVKEIPETMRAKLINFDGQFTAEQVHAVVAEQGKALANEPFAIKIVNGRLVVSGKDALRLAGAQAMDLDVAVSFNPIDILNEYVRSHGYKNLEDYYARSKKVKKYREKKKGKKKPNRISPKQAETLVRKYFSEEEVGVEFVEAIRTPDGRRALGKYFNKMVTFINDPKNTTPEHEVLHAFFDLFTSKERKEAILEEVGKRTGIEDVGEREEWLADSFADYAMGRRKLKTWGEKITAYFKDMLAKIKTLIGKGDVVDELYRDIIGRKRPKMEEASVEEKFQTEDELMEEARKYKTVEEFIAKMHGSATQYGDYLPYLRLGGSNPDSKRLSELGIDPEQIVTIYRGIDDRTGKVKLQINDGDFVTTDYESALAYASGKDMVVSKDVKAKDLFAEDTDEFLDEPFYVGSEYVYSSVYGAPKQLSEVELKNIWNKAHQTKFQTDDDLTTKILKRLGDRETVSRQFILDLTNQPDVKQVEKDLVRTILNGFEGDKISVQEFKARVGAELLPLSVESFDSPEDMGDFMEYKGTFQRYENITLPDDLRGEVQDYAERIYQSPVKVSAGKVHFAERPDSDYYFGHTRTEDMADGVTRRVIEVQSDLYQKGNLEKELDRAGRIDGSIANKPLTVELAQESLNEYQTALSNWRQGKRKMAEFSNDPYFYADSEEMLVERVEEWKRLLAEAKSGKIGARKLELSKLSQYNDPTAHFRMIREELKQASVDGKEKLLFPTGETAMKVEGLGQAASFKIEDASLPHSRMMSAFKTLDNDNIQVGLEIFDLGRNNWVVTDILGDGKFKAVPKNKVFTKADYLSEDLGYKPINENQVYKSTDVETFDISGKVDKNNPIYKFYEKDVARYLKTNYQAKPFTDDLGVTWMAVDVKPEYSGAVEAFQLDDEQDLLEPVEGEFVRREPQEVGLSYYAERMEDLKARIIKADFKKEQQIANAQEMLSGAMEFSDSELENSYALYEQMSRKYRKWFNDLPQEPEAIANFLANKKEFNKPEDFGTPFNRLFETSDQQLYPEDILNMFVERLEQEKAFEQIAKQKTPKEKALLMKQLAARIVRSATVGRKMSTRQAVANITRGSLIDAKRKVEISERRLLRMRFGVAQRVSRQVARAVRRQVSDIMKAGFKQETAKLQEYRNVLTKHVNLLPREARTDNMIKLIKNVKDLKTFADAYTRIDGQMQRYQKADYIKSIRKLLKRVLESPSVALEYKKAAESLLAEVQFTAPNKETVRRLSALKSYLDREYKAGNHVYIPTKVYETLKRLQLSSIRELSLDELQNIYEEMQQLEDVGRLKINLEKRAWERTNQSIAESTIPELVAYDKPEVLRGEAGNDLTNAERLGNLARRIKRSRMHFGMSIRPMDIFFDLYSGGQGVFNTNFFRNFKARIDTDFQQYLELRAQYTNQVATMAQKLKLKTANYERIGIYAAKVQEDGVQKLLARGLSQEMIDSIELTRNETLLYNKMREHFEDLYPSVKRHMRLLYNKDVGKLDNYFPFVMDFDAMTNLEIGERFGFKPEEDFGGTPRKNYVIGATIERVKNANQAIQINAMEIYLNHIDNAAYMVRVAPTIKQLTEVAKRKDFKDALGDYGSEILLKWLDTLARKGGVENARQLNRVFDDIRRNVGAGVLALKVSSALMQPSAFFDGAAEIGMSYAMRGAHAFATDADMRMFMMENAPELMARVGNDPAFQELSRNDLIKKFQQLGFTPLQALDSYTASSITIGAYLKRLEELKLDLDLTKPNKDALAYAQLVLRRTQNSSYFKDLPLALSRGELTGNLTVDKLFFQFQSFMLNRWSYISYDLPQKLRRDPKAGVNALTWLLMASVYARSVSFAYKATLAAIFGNEEEEDPFLTVLSQEILGTIPFVSSIWSSAEYRSAPVPIIRTGVDFFGGGLSAVKAKSGKTRAKATVRFITGGGMLLGVPGSVEARNIILEALSD